MPIRPIKDSAVEAYEYINSDEEDYGVTPGGNLYEEDSQDEWEVDAETLCRENCLFTFKFGCRVISAWGKACSSIHPNVHRLEVARSWLDLLPRLLCKILPFLQTWALTRWPEWFLPPTLVLKRQKPQWEEEFEREIEAYAKVRPLQGFFFPICYGEVRCCLGGDWRGTAKKRRSLLLSDLGGWDLNSDECPPIEIAELERMLRDALTASVEYGVIPSSDGRLENLRFVDGKVMFMDLEQYSAVSKAESDELVEYKCKYLLKRYLDHQKAAANERSRLRANRDTNAPRQRLTRYQPHLSADNS